MKNHVLRPLFVFLIVVGLILLSRVFLVPKDFGTNELGYRFGWHRAGNEQEWRDFKVKYAGSDYCMGCHDDKYSSIKSSPHQNIQCENCHGPAGDHPSDPPKLVIDTSRAQCLRCHFPLPYSSSDRSKIKGVDPETHNPGIDCSQCHNPHSPTAEARK
jgi:predicted CXXCH cytochrome family protein